MSALITQLIYSIRSSAFINPKDNLRHTRGVNEFFKHPREKSSNNWFLNRLGFYLKKRIFLPHFLHTRFVLEHDDEGKKGERSMNIRLELFFLVVFAPCLHSPPPPSPKRLNNESFCRMAEQSGLLCSRSGLIFLENREFKLDDSRVCCRCDVAGGWWR